MFHFFKNLFKNKYKLKKILDVTSLENDYQNWLEIVQQNTILDLSLLDKLEILFIKLDIGIKTSNYLISEIKKNIIEQKITKSCFLLPLIKETILAFYQTNNLPIILEPKIINSPQIYLFVGVNGVGKSTTIGKLAFRWGKKKKKILLVAGDTFRTGAIEQLKLWGKVTNNEVFWKEGNIKPSNLFFEALNYAQTKKFDIILCDTSGRLQNKNHLMKELEKIRKIIQNKMPQSSLETFLILDAMTGQNGLSQVNLFNEVTFLNNIILTKYDGTSKGGLILAIKHIYNLNTKYVGIGEGREDLITFNIRNYVDNLFEK